MVIIVYKKFYRQQKTLGSNLFEISELNNWSGS